jgi:hypothetical protein
MINTNRWFHLFTFCRHPKLQTTIQDGPEARGIIGFSSALFNQGLINFAVISIASIAPVVV